MRFSSILCWVGAALILIGLPYPAIMLVGFITFLGGTIMRNIQIDRTWKELDKKLKRDE